MARSILDTLALAATLTVAAPVALAGAFFLADGDVFVGTALVVVAALAIAFEQYLTTPSDVPAEAAKTAVGAVVEDPDDEE